MSSDRPHNLTLLWMQAQPVVGNYGGINATRLACDFVRMFGTEICTHNWAGPLTTLATLQYTAVIPNLFRQEWPHVRLGLDWETEIVAPALKVQKGRVAVPTGPGIGAEPDIAALQKRRIPG